MMLVLDWITRFKRGRTEETGLQDVGGYLDSSNFLSFLRRGRYIQKTKSFLLKCLLVFLMMDRYNTTCWLFFLFVLTSIVRFIVYGYVLRCFLLLKFRCSWVLFIIKIQMYLFLMVFVDLKVIIHFVHQRVVDLAIYIEC